MPCGAEFTPLEIDEESLAFGAHEEVGHGGHFLGAQHTMERFRECFYRPLLSSTANYERWVRLGAKDATARAGEICAKTLAEYQAPPLDDGIRAELESARHLPPRRTRRLTARPGPAARFPACRRQSPQSHRPSSPHFTLNVRRNGQNTPERRTVGVKCGCRPRGGTRPAAGG